MLEIFFIFLFGMILIFIINTLTEILEKLEKVLSYVTPNSADRLVFIAKIGGQYMEINNMNLKVTQTLDLSIVAKDQFGNVAKIDGAPVWSLTAPALGALDVAADGLSAKFTPSGQVGSLSVNASADADLGAGVKTILGELPVDLAPGDAVTVEISGVAKDA